MSQIVSSIILDYESEDDYYKELEDIKKTLDAWNKKYDEYHYEIIQDVPNLTIQVDIYVLNTEGNTYFGEGDSLSEELTDNISYGNNYISI